MYVLNGIFILLLTAILEMAPPRFGIAEFDDAAGPCAPAGPAPTVASAGGAGQKNTANAGQSKPSQPTDHWLNTSFVVSFLF